jgi:hypothetical protein
MHDLMRGMPRYYSVCMTISPSSPSLHHYRYTNQVGWMNFFLLLCVASIFYRPALYVVIALLSTLALPAKPVLWPWFNKLWVFKTWRVGI